MKFRKGVDTDLELPLVLFIELAERVAGIEFEVTSGRRKGKGTHAEGVAVDIACADGPLRYKILKGLTGAGFRRIGIYDRHIHADRSLTRPDWVWLGTSL